MTDDRLLDDAVLMRTHAGQGAAFEDPDLDAPGRRLLLLANGYTPLSGLAKLLDARVDWHATARELLERRLVDVQG